MLWNPFFWGQATVNVSLKRNLHQCWSSLKGAAKKSDFSEQTHCLRSTLSTLLLAGFDVVSPFPSKQRTDTSSHILVSPSMALWFQEVLEELSLAGMEFPYSHVCAVLSQSQAGFRCCPRLSVSCMRCSRMDTPCTFTATPGWADPPPPSAAGSSTWWAGAWGRCSTSSWPKGRLCTLMKMPWPGLKRIFFRSLGRFVPPYAVCRWRICLSSLPISLESLGWC